MRMPMFAQDLGAEMAIVDPGDGTQYGPPAPGLIQTMGFGWDTRTTIGAILGVGLMLYLWYQGNEE